LGVLFLRGDEAGTSYSFNEQLATTASEQIALAIANLRLRETLRSQSILDPLTGIYNRRFMEETLAREIRRTERSQRDLSVLMFDLDHFKKFNDTFGHEGGDVLLRELGQLLRERFLSQFTASFNMRRMLAMYAIDSLEETVCSKSRDKRR